MFTTPQDYFKSVQDSLASFPKTEEDIKAVFEKTKNVVTTEAASAKEVIATYNKASRGEASMNEISLANKKAQELFVAARFAAVMALPGAIFALPVLSKMADEFDVDFVPASVKKEFSI